MRDDSRIGEIDGDRGGWWAAHEPVRATDALVVVDLQRDFVEAGRPAAVAGAPSCLAPIVAAADAVRGAGGTVVWVRREYAADGSDVERSRLERWRRAPFCVTGTSGADLAAGVIPHAGDLDVVKRRWSAFFGTPLASLLADRGVDRVVVAGVDLSRCVRATVVDAISHDFDAAIMAAGTSTRTPAAKRSNLEDLQDLGATVFGDVHG